MKERDIERRLRIAMKAAGGECLKWVSPGRRGVHDRICIFPGGLTYYVETKSPVGKLRPEQRRFHARLRALGCNSFVISQPSHVDDLVRGMCKPACFRCGTTKGVSYGPDPYAHDIHDDDTPVFQCDSCAGQSADDI